MIKTNYQEIEYKGKKYIKAIYKTTVGNIPCNMCVWGKNSKCNKPKDFNLSCGSWGYIKEVF